MEIDFRFTTEKEGKEYIAKMFALISDSYNQEKENESVKKAVDIIYDYFKIKGKLNESNLKMAKHELLQNYSAYRKVNAASFISAYYKKSKE